MRIETKTEIWVVTDPGEMSTIHDILYKTDLLGLQNLMRGRDVDVQYDNMVVYARQDAAQADALGRLNRRGVRP